MYYTGRRLDYRVTGAFDSSRRHDAAYTSYGDAWLAVITLRVAVNPFAAVSSCYTLTFHRWAVTLAILIGGVTNAEGTASVVRF